MATTFDRDRHHALIVAMQSLKRVPSPGPFFQDVASRLDLKFFGGQSLNRAVHLNGFFPFEASIFGTFPGLKV